MKVTSGMHQVVLMGIILWMLSPFLVYAQLADPVAFQLNKEKLPKSVEAGTIFYITVDAAIDENWYLYSILNDPGDGPIPTTFTSAGSDMIIAAQQGGGSGAFNLLLLLAIPLVFYFLLIRPQQRRQRQRRELVSSVEVGDRIVTIGGIHGTVQSLDEDTMRVEVAPGMVLTVSKGAVGDKVVDADTGTTG
jgi:preprotein translocase YajC subunit